MPEPQKYQVEYEDFIFNEYKKGTVDGERVGEVVARMAQYYALANGDYASALIAYNLVSSAMEQTKDELGKTISSAKATKMAEASSEFATLAKAKAKVENIEQIINALKALQRGIMSEMGSSNLI